MLLEPQGRQPRFGKDGNVVPVWVFNKLGSPSQRVRLEIHGNKDDNLLMVSLYVKVHVRDDGGCQEVTVTLLLRLVSTPIQDDRPSLFFVTGDRPIHLFEALGKACVFVLPKDSVDAQSPGGSNNILTQTRVYFAVRASVIRDTALSGRVKGSVNDGVQWILLNPVRQD